MKKVFIDEAPDYNRRKRKDDILTILFSFLFISGLSYLLVSEEEKHLLPWGLIAILTFIVFVFGFSSGIGYHVYHLSIEGNTVTIEYLVTDKFFQLKPQKINFNIEGTSTNIKRNSFFYILDKNKMEVLQVDLSKHKGFDTIWKEVIAYYQKHKEPH